MLIGQKIGTGVSVLGIGVLCFFVGRITAPTKGETVTVQKTDTKAEEKSATNVADHTVTQIITVKEPNGTVQTTETIKNDVDTVKNTDTVSESQTSTVTKENALSRYSVSAGELSSILGGYKGLYGTFSIRVSGMAWGELGYDSVSGLPHLGLRIEW